MRGDRIAALILFVGSAALIALGAILYIGKDRKEPEIVFVPSALIYTEETAESELLQGVSAHDDRDGDVTERIVVEKIVASAGESAAVVYYAASDTAGNVAKASRRFEAKLEPKEEPETGEGAPGAEAALGTEISGGIVGHITEASEEQTAKEAGEDMSGADQDAEKEEDEEEAAAEEAIDEAARAAEEAAEVAEQEEAERARKEAAERAEKEAREQAEAAARAAEEAAARAAEEAEKPHITLKKTSVTVPAGTAPAWVDVIGSLTDNKDGYERLFKNLSVSKYDKNTPGTYTVSITTTDSDKNVSDPATLTIVVK